MSRKADSKKSDIWREHLTKWEQYEGTQTSYCTQAGISVRNFNYWKQRFRNEGLLNSKTVNPAIFLPVQLKAAHPEVAAVRNSLPDPRWVSEIIFEISRRFA